MESRKLKLQFDQSMKRLEHETRSKFLNPDSEFFFFILDGIEKLKHSGFRFEPKMDPHVQILSFDEYKRKDNLDLFLKRVQKLHNIEIDVNDRNNYKIINKKNFVLTLPTIDGIDYYISIAYLNTLAPHKDKFLNILLDKNYSTYSDFEFTVFD